MRLLIVLWLALVASSAYAVEVCIEIPEAKVDDAQTCKADYLERTGKTLTNSQLLSIAAMEFCRKERRLAESVAIFSTIQAKEDLMEAGWCSCGDNSLCYLEVCDDGNTSNGDGCNSICVSDESCGNGYLDLGEDCDDGNVVDGDGCQSDCTVTPTTTTTLP